MIYDCFNFFNELDLLEIRLNELDPVVDRFVIVESTRTFQKKEKPLIFQQNQERFSRFSDKIIHVVVDKFPGFFAKFRVPTAWDYSNYQKNQIMQGIRNCNDDDVIIFSDLDEIPRAEKILEYKNRPGTKVFQQRLYTYFLNCAVIKTPPEASIVNKNGKIYWTGSVMANFSEFKNAREFRKRRNKSGDGIIQIEDGGWHFTYLGGMESVMYKVKSLEHASEEKYQFDHLNDPKVLEEMINQGKDLYDRDIEYEFMVIDESYPVYVKKEQEKFSKLIKQ